MLLSIILPVHNTATYLPKCIESIINQGLKCDDFEIILVENASTDNSLDVCKKLKEQYSKNNIVIIHTDVPGVSKARNIGIDISQGKYIHFIDSDDWIDSGMFSFLKSENVNDYDLLITGIINDYEKSHKTINEVATMPITCESRKQISDLLLQLDNKQKIWCLNVIWNKWYKAEVIKKCNIRFRDDINLGEDFVFNCSFMKKIGRLKITSAVYYHYMHRGNVTLVNKFRTDILYRRPIIYNAYCSLYEYYGILQNKKEYIDLLEGKLLFGSLYTIFNRDCYISYSEKLDFIKTICKSNYFALSIRYLKCSHSLYHKILYILIFARIYFAVYLVLFLKFKCQEICKMFY